MASVRWTSHLPVPEQQDFTVQVYGSKNVLKRLAEIVQEDYNVSDKEMHKRATFIDASWPYKQAYELGYQKALSTVLTLLKV
jgi:hypothetical protein